MAGRSNLPAWSVLVVVRFSVSGWRCLRPFVWPCCGLALGLVRPCRVAVWCGGVGGFRRQLRLSRVRCRVGGLTLAYVAERCAVGGLLGRCWRRVVMRAGINAVSASQGPWAGLVGGQFSKLNSNLMGTCRFQECVFKRSFCWWCCLRGLWGPEGGAVFLLSVSRECVLRCPLAVVFLSISVLLPVAGRGLGGLGRGRRGGLLRCGLWVEDMVEWVSWVGGT